MATFERFTDRARWVVVHAQEEARQLGHGFIGTEHILLGIMREGEGVGAKALQELDISLDAVRAMVEGTVRPSGEGSTTSPQFTPRAKKVLELSLRQALELGHNYIGTEHLLLGIVREEQNVAGQILAALGADRTAVGQTVIMFLAGYSPGSQAGPSGWVSRAPGDLRLVICSFCGRRSPETGRLVASGRAAICEHCIRDWHGCLENSDEVPEAHGRLIDPTDEQPREEP